MKVSKSMIYNDDDVKLSMMICNHDYVKLVLCYICLEKSLKGLFPDKIINPFYSNVTFLYPLKTYGFLTFSGGIEM